MSETILNRIAAGDQNAVNECLNAYGGLVFTIARRFLNEHSEAEDAVQDIFVDVWKSAGRFDPLKGSEKAFVTTIARRRLIDRRRKSGLVPPAQSLTDETTLPTTENAVEHVDVCDEARVAAEALDKLRPEQKRVLELSIFHGLTHEQIASQVAMPLGTVKTHARRGLMRVRELLKGPSPAEEAAR